jgi:hypothetical protein
MCLLTAAMKRSGLISGVLPLITAVSLGVGALAPARAEEAPAKAPEAAPPSEASAASPGLNEKEKALLQRINALKTPRWRPFGACRYDWSGWKLMADGVRTTGVQCGPETAATPDAAAPTASVAVHCDTLKLSVRSGDQAWSSWRLPYAASESKERGGEDLMVASLCANAKPIPRAQPAAPPAVNPAAKPAATPQKKPATAAPVKKPAATKP